MNVAGALVTANSYVWTVKVLGARPKNYAIKVPVEAFSVSDVSYWKWSDGLDVEPFFTYFESPDPVPLGPIAMSRGRGPILWHTGGSCSEPGPTATPEGIVAYHWWWNRCYPADDVTAHGWRIDLDTLFDIDYSGPDSPETFESYAQELTQAQIEQRLRDLLTSGDPDYADLIDWLNANLGGESQNPKDIYLTAPSCANVTYAVCVDRFRAAGFLGTITASTLASDDAVMERAANRVTDTVPHANTQAAKGKAITVYRNPATMPRMTATENQIATTLKTKNPDVVKDSNKKTVARRCVKFAIAATRSPSVCTSLPILLQGSDVYNPAINEIAALARNPSWFVLNRRSPPRRTEWYKNRAEPSPGCLGSEQGALEQCDEFPFWPTLQAYGGTLNTAVPGIRWVPGRENRRQGAVLSQFYSANAAGPSLTFKGCNIAAQPASATAPTTASTFLNVAVAPGVPIPSVGICNKP